MNIDRWRYPERHAHPALAGAWRRCASLLACIALLQGLPAAAQTQTERFAIERFEVTGNTLLDPGAIAEAVGPYTGPSREYGDVQRALEALELLYRERGYTAVQVYVPEQELSGVVRLEVTEARIGAVTVSGPRHFDERNIRASLPALVQGRTPNAADISADVQLANENPAKNVEVVLRAGEREGVVDAEVRVTDSAPLKWFVTGDNTGNDQTGNWRAGIGLQHANVFGRDHVLTLNYASSPGRWSDVKIMSAGYRVPLYRAGHSVDFILAKSNVNAGTTTTVAGPLTFAGTGEIAGVRYNWLLPRRGLYSHRVVVALDYKAFDNTCALGAFGAAGCGSAGVDITSRPATVTYAGQWAQLRSVTEFALGYSRNIPGAGKGRASDFAAARPSPSGLGGADAGFEIFRAAGSHTRLLPNDFQLRLAGVSQYTPDALIPQEQIGIAGALTVRGFTERELARDMGYAVNTELYTPDLASHVRAAGSLRLLAFYDRGAARNRALPGETGQAETISSVGSGLRWNLDKKASVRFDLARVIQGVATRPDGSWRAHVALYYAF